MAQRGAAEVVRLRNDFYRDSYHRVMLALLLALSIVVALIALMGWMVTHPPQPKYFATSINGRITPLQPLSRPNQTDSALLQWANQAAIAAYSYNFVNYQSELQAASEFFTTAGWRRFAQALKDTNSVATVRENRLIVSAVATGAPVILNKGVRSDRYFWRVQMPLLVTYQGPGIDRKERYVVTMEIVRISPLEHPRGIGIAQFVATREGGTRIGG